MAIVQLTTVQMAIVQISGCRLNTAGIPCACICVCACTYEYTHCVHARVHSLCACMHACMYIYAYVYNVFVTACVCVGACMNSMCVLCTGVSVCMCVRTYTLRACVHVHKSLFIIYNFFIFHICRGYNVNYTIVRFYFIRWCADSCFSIECFLY